MKYVVVLDAGHGGLINGVYQTKGKRSPVWDDGSQYFEGVGNREIYKKLRAKLTANCIEVYNPNESDIDMPLRTRTSKINDYIKNNSDKKFVGISIHSNGFSKESAHGWSVYTYTKASEDSKKLSSLLAKEMKVQFPDRRLRGEKTAGFWMLKHTNCPFVLTENFFMTNKDECQNILMNEEKQDKIVDIHFNAIMEFIK
jgi:N-acetylmuramoyl-L-alanine amidase